MISIIVTPRIILKVIKAMAPARGENCPSPNISHTIRSLYMTLENVSDINYLKKVIGAIQLFGELHGYKVS